MECLNAICLANSTCSDGCSGTGCLECEAGFHLTANFTCNQCTAVYQQVLLGLLLLVGLCAYVIYKAENQKAYLTDFDIGFEGLCFCTANQRDRDGILFLELRSQS